MNRRHFVQGGSALFAASLYGGTAQPALSNDAGAPAGEPFSRAVVIEAARRLASEPYVDRAETIPDDLRAIGYDEYRDIRFKEAARIWQGENLPFTLDLFHPGFIFNQPVRLNLVNDGRSSRLHFSSDLFEYGENVQPPREPDLGFSGFRVRSRINTPDFWDEFLVFQGASYFRAIGRKQFYGLSARGLAIDTGEPEGEEFPSFVEYWIERPAPRDAMLVIHALLDSPSTTGAFTFQAIPGAETVVEVEAAIFPRTEIRKLGIAPLTSMFFFDATNRWRFQDFRSAVHDSDGLQMLTGAGEWLWRPLANPAELQISAFGDRSPQGFGLMQRSRRFEDFEDLEAHYERRPSLWIEPLGDWGAGAVELVEIPTRAEINDNIVAYWRPNGAVPAGGPWDFSYRMRWTDFVQPEGGLMTVAATRIGKSTNGDEELVVVDFTRPEGVDADDLAIDASASDAQITHSGALGILPDGNFRVALQFDPGGSELVELRLRLVRAETPASETWLYRWTSS